MTAFGFGGYGVQGSDPDLAEKIAKVKSGRSNTKQQLNDFIEHDLGLDPREIPFTWKAACARAVQMMDNVDHAIVSLRGSSLGLKMVAFTDVNQGGVRLIRLTEASHGEYDWHDWERIHRAFVKNTGLDGKPAYSFEIERSWDQEDSLTVTPRQADPVKPKPSDYPQGTLLRIQRQLFIDGDSSQEWLDVSVGGLFDDNGVMILATMQPITDLTGWTVQEEL